jgi:hypothetical protein
MVPGGVAVRTSSLESAKALLKVAMVLERTAARRES